jgi:hypothetical protein
MDNKRSTVRLVVVRQSSPLADLYPALLKPVSPELVGPKATAGQRRLAFKRLESRHQTSTVTLLLRHKYSPLAMISRAPPRDIASG